MSDWSRDAAAATGSAESALRNGADTARSTARGAAKAANDMLAKSNDAVRAGADQVSATASMLSEQIRNQPVTAAAVCLGFGFLAGMLLARRR